MVEKQPCHRKEMQIVFKLAKRLMSLTYKKGSEILKYNDIFFYLSIGKGQEG